MTYSESVERNPILMKNCKSPRFAFVALSFASLFASGVAQAQFTGFTPTSLTSLTNTLVSDQLRTTAIGFDHRAYMPATALGMLIGVDIGVDGTLMNVPSDFRTAVSTITGQTSTDIPSSLIIPRLNIHKGLPMGLDIGGSIVTLGSNLTLFGVDAKYEVIGGLTLPAIAVRGSYNSAKFSFMSTTTWDVDVVVSKNFVLIDPYFGAGMQFWSGSLTFDAAVAATLPTTVATTASGSNPRFYVGLPIKLGFMRLTGQYDYSTSGVTSYGVKASLGF
jgi:hypothetical protein